MSLANLLSAEQIIPEMKVTERRLSPRIAIRFLPR